MITPMKEKIRRIRSNDEVALRDEPEDPYSPGCFQRVERNEAGRGVYEGDGCVPFESNAYYPDRTIETMRDQNINTSLTLKVQMLEEKRKMLTSAPVGGAGTRETKPMRMVVFSSNVR